MLILFNGIGESSCLLLLRRRFTVHSHPMAVNWEDIGPVNKGEFSISSCYASFLSVSHRYAKNNAEFARGGAADIIVTFKPRSSDFQGLETKTFPIFAKIGVQTPAPSTKPVLYLSK
jgi:hypothetical protein